MLKQNVMNCYGFVMDLFNIHNNKLTMLNETYVFTSPSEDMKYMYFPEGLGLLGDSHYYLMKYIQPFHFGENGYELTDIRIRGIFSTDGIFLCNFLSTQSYILQCFCVLFVRILVAFHVYSLQ